MAKNTITQEEIESPDFVLPNDLSMDPQKDNKPSKTDPGWTQYVLDQLTKDEQYEGNPKADGLRRLVEHMVGPIIDEATELKSWPTNGKDIEANTATALCSVTVLDNTIGKPVRTISVADASCLSVTAPFNKFISCLAETRALARCYRRILRLKGVVTADELSTDPKDRIIDSMTPNQIELIDRMCSEFNINVKQLVMRVLDSSKPNIRAYTQDQGSQVLDKLNATRNLVAAGKKIPTELLGYDKDWREYFG